MMPTKVDCSMMLSRMPTWKNFGMKIAKQASATSRMSQTRLSRAKARSAFGRSCLGSSARGRHSTAETGVAGGLRLPQNFGSSTLSLVIAAPGILMFGPQLSMVSSEGRPITS